MKFSKINTFKLFLFIAFPIHAWLIILFLRDFEWISERSNAWDAIGVLSYGLIYVLLETLIVLLIFLIANRLLPKQWEQEKRISFLSSTFLVIVFWAILVQLYAIKNEADPGFIENILISSGHPIRWGSIGLAALIFLVIFPCLMIFISHKSEGSPHRLINNIVERVTVLSSFYIFLDVVGILIVIIRNI